MHFSTCVLVHFTFTKVDIIGRKNLVCQIIGPAAAGPAGPVPTAVQKIVQPATKCKRGLSRIHSGRTKLNFSSRTAVRA